MRSSRNDDEASDFYNNKRPRDNDRGYQNRYRERDRRRSRSRSRSRDLYKDMIDDDSWNREKNYDRKNRDRDRDRREYDRRDYRKNYHSSNYYDEDEREDSQEDYDNNYSAVPNSKIIVRGLAQHITEADIQCDLIQCGLKPISIRLIRKKTTGASRGFAFVEFATEEEARTWIEKKQGVLILQDQYRAMIQYSFIKDGTDNSRDKIPTDWYCAKCGVFNFKRRDNCFKCYASREESEKGGEGSDEISSILTKKIMFRNLDALTNEEKVLCTLQEKIPSMVSVISKILICRDPLTQTSRGICYLNFDNLVDSMNTFNALKALKDSLQIDNREVMVTYCMDNENRSITKSNMNGIGGNSTHNNNNNNARRDITTVPKVNNNERDIGFNNYQYTLADVPRLAEYSTNIYAKTSAERESFMAYYTEYYTNQITQGITSNLPSQSQVAVEAHSGAAVAQSAIERKYKSKTTEIYGPQLPVIGPSSYPQAMSSGSISSAQELPLWNDGKKYPTPDASQYQYDETSGYYYDPTTGLYYDATSQYYYNSTINQYMYWDQEQSTYLLAPSSNGTTYEQNRTSPSIQQTNDLSKPAAKSNLNQNQNDDQNTKKLKETKNGDQPQDKVKVAKKIVKDMEKWAKQLNQKKDYVPIAQQSRSDDPSSSATVADVGYIIMEKKDRSSTIGTTYTTNQSSPVIGNTSTKMINSLSDSDGDHEDATVQKKTISDKELVDFDKLMCLLCKRAFQSAEILNKHCKMSDLHKENLQKFKMQKGISDVNSGLAGNQSYRDRAKERRQKYGEVDPPPVNRSKERFQREMEKQASMATAYEQASKVASKPIDTGNIGNKLLQKMGWKEGTGLGRKNQGRTELVEAEARVASAGLGVKGSSYGSPGDDYKTYIKRMMKKRYEEVE